VQFLLQKGAVIDAQLPNGHTPLMVALLNNNLQVAEALLKAGARLDIPGDNILQLCIRRSRNNAVKLLLQQPVIRKLLDPLDAGLLETAIENDDYVLVSLLITFCRITQEQGDRFLRTAILKNNHEIVRLLLKNGVKGDARQLRTACADVGANIFKELLLSGLNLEDLMPEVATCSVLNYIRTVINPTRAFIAAAQKNDPDTCLDMLNHKSIEINLPDELGNTALHYCVKNNNEEMVKELLMHGADPTIKNNEGNTPLHYAMPGMVRIFVTAAMPLKEVGIRTVFQESKTLATHVSATIRSYQAACNRMSNIKTANTLISYLGYAVSAGLLCLTAYKGYPAIQSHEIDTFSSKAWQPLVASIFSFATTVCFSKIYKHSIANYFMQKHMDNLFASRCAISRQALVLQQQIKNESHKRLATKVFSDHLQVSNGRIRQDMISEFNPQNDESLASKIDSSYSELYKEIHGH
jgi:ankyrin repeat protein